VKKGRADFAGVTVGCFVCWSPVELMKQQKWVTLGMERVRCESSGGEGCGMFFSCDLFNFLAWNVD
jgi:hypothetical protein